MIIWQHNYFDILQLYVFDNNMALNVINKKSSKKVSEVNRDEDLWHIVGYISEEKRDTTT